MQHETLYTTLTPIPNSGIFNIRDRISPTVEFPHDRHFSTFSITQRPIWIRVSVLLSRKSREFVGRRRRDILFRFEGRPSAATVSNTGGRTPYIFRRREKIHDYFPESLAGPHRRIDFRSIMNGSGKCKQRPSVSGPWWIHRHALNPTIKQGPSNNADKKIPTSRKKSSPGLTAVFWTIFETTKIGQELTRNVRERMELMWNATRSYLDLIGNLHIAVRHNSGSLRSRLPEFRLNYELSIGGHARTIPG